MGKRLWAVVAGACALALVVVVPGKAQQAKGWVPYTGVKQTGFAVTPPVRSMPKASPHAGPPVQVPILHRPSIVPSPQQPTTPDPALQTVPGAPLNAVAEPGFGGVGFNGYYPPDPNSSVGGEDSAGHEEVVETTNVEFSVYDAATGKVLSGPTSMDTLFSGLGGTLCATNNGGDPVVLWDKIAHRWLISQLAYTNNLRNDEACIAISQTADATGKYNAYGFSFSSLTDYPKYGVWSSSATAHGSDYYFSANLFSMSRYYGPVVCAFNGADMQNAKSARYACDQNMSPSNFSLLPSDSDGSTPPGQAEPNYFVELGNSSSLIMYPFLATWTSPGGGPNGTGGALNNPTAITMSVPSYIEACSGGGTCIPQPGTNQQLDSLGDRLMYRLAFRKQSPSGGESLVVNNSVDEGNGIVGIRWYEFTTTGIFNDYEASGKFTGSSTNTYDGTFGPDGNYRWMGSIAQDRNGDIALGYSESNGSSLYPSIYYTGTANPSSDPNSYSMGSESPLLIGTGAETGSYRWGDYSSMSVDPADDCTFWYTNEYFNANASSSVSWNTYIAPFNFNSCPTFDISLSSASATVSAGTSATYSIDLAAGTGFSDTIALSATDLSNGLTGPITINGSVSPSVSVGLTSGTSTPVTVSVDTSGMAAGTYTFYVVGEDSSKTDGAGGALAKGLPLTLTITGGSGGGSSVAVSSLTLNPTSVTGGTSSQGTVTLNQTVSSNTTVTLSLYSGPTGVLTMPSSVIVPGGSKSVQFTVSTTAVASNDSFTIQAADGTSSANGTLQVLAPTVSSLSFNPSAVTAGTPSQGTVTLNGPAPSNGATVALSSGDLSIANVPASGNVVISAGQTSASFQVTTGPSSGTVNITATYPQGSTGMSVPLTVNPASTGGPFTVSVPTTQTTQIINPGQDPTYDVTVTSGGFSGSVTLAVTWSPSQPKFSNDSFSTNPVTVSPSAPGTSILTVRTNKKVAAGNYTLTITATSGSQTSTATVYLDIK